MNKDTITFVLNGKVLLEDLSTALFGFKELIGNLQKKHAKNINIEWEVEDLESHSAKACIRGISELEEGIFAIDKIVKDYDDVAKKVSTGKIRELPKRIQKSVEKITSVINGRIPSITFETDESDYVVHDKQLYEDRGEGNLVYLSFPSESYGAITGRVQALNREGQFRFTLYENTTQKAVSCYLKPDYEEKMREIWGKIAIVEGLVRRDPLTGTPTSIRNVNNITQISELKPGEWREAIGCAPNLLKNESPEEFIRRIRNA